MVRSLVTAVVGDLSTDKREVPHQGHDKRTEA